MNQNRVLPSVELAEGTKKKVIVSGKPVMLARIDGEVYATDDTCTHEQCSLGEEGFLDGASIVCGCHGAVFDIANGQVISLPATEDLKTYKTEEKNGHIFVSTE